MKLSTRLMLAMGLVVLFTVFINSLVTYRNLVNTTIPVELERLKTEVRHFSSELETYVQQSTADLMAVRWSTPISGILREKMVGESGPRSDSTYEAWLKRLQGNLEAELLAHPEFLQFRLIGLENEGSEIIRIERDKSHGPVRVIPDDELQKKAHRSYFIETIKLPGNDVYISPIELNREHNIIQDPHVPVLRLSTPVHFQNGAIFGILIINIDVWPLFTRIRGETREAQAFYIINEHGDYLLHPDDTIEFGFELGSPARIQDDYPYIGKLIGTRDNDNRLWKDAAGNRYGMAMVPLQFTTGPWIAFIKRVPYKTLIAPVSTLLHSSLIAAVFSFFCAIILSGIVSRGMISALSKIARAVEQFKGKGTISVPPDTTVDEINTLGKAFNRMSVDLQAKTAEKNRIDLQFKSAVEHSPSGIVMINEYGKIVLVNAQMASLFGYSREELVGMTIEDLVPQRYREQHASLRNGFMQDLQPRRMGTGRDLYALRKDGTEFPVEIALTPVESEEGTMVLTTIIDITQRKRSEQAIKASLAEKEVLLKEVYHRVKNNLEIISSLLSLQEKKIPEGVVRDALRDSGTRVKSMSLVHNMLYQSEKYTSIDIGNYMERLLREFRSVHGSLSRNIDVEANIDPVELDISSAIPLGLLVNELLSNCFRYAFPEDSPGKVSISLLKNGENYTLSVSDNGIGMPDNFDPALSSSLGFTLVNALAAQLEGEVVIDTDNGTTVTVNFKIPEPGNTQPE